MNKSLISFLALSVIPLHAEPLSEEQKREIILEVQVVLYAEEANLLDNASEAKKVLSVAVEKESSAMALYYEAIQKINFTDKNKKASEFLDWKNKNRSKLSSLGFRKLTVLELKWLSLATDSYTAVTPEAEEKLVDNIVSYLDEYYMELGTIEGGFAKAKDKAKGGGKKTEEKEANDSVNNLLSSEVAKFLKLDILEIKDWPANPTELDIIYDKLILPSIRASFDLNGIKGAWEKRLEHEKLLIQAFDMENKGGLQGGGRENNTKAMQSYLKAKHPLLLWKMYNDLYRYGGQKQGAEKMVKHIKEYEEHPKRKEWAEQLLLLLDL